MFQLFSWLFKTKSKLSSSKKKSNQLPNRCFMNINIQRLKPQPQDYSLSVSRINIVLIDYQTWYYQANLKSFYWLRKHTNPKLYFIVVRLYYIFENYFICCERFDNIFRFDYKWSFLTIGFLIENLWTFKENDCSY